MPLLEHMSVQLLSHFEFFHSTSEFFPGDGVIEFPHGTLLWNMFKNCMISGAMIVEDIVEMGSKDFHLVSVRESHCHVRQLVVVHRFAFRKETNVLPF